MSIPSLQSSSVPSIVGTTAESTSTVSILESLDSRGHQPKRAPGTRALLTAGAIASLTIAGLSQTALWNEVPSRDEPLSSNSPSPSDVVEEPMQIVPTIPSAEAPPASLVSEAAVIRDMAPPVRTIPPENMTDLGEAARPVPITTTIESVPDVPPMPPQIAVSKTARRVPSATSLVRPKNASVTAAPGRPSGHRDPDVDIITAIVRSAGR